MSSGQNNFKIDLNYGKKYELLTILKLQEKFNYKLVEIPNGKCEGYDIKMSHEYFNKFIKFEVKTTRSEYETIFIEYSNKNNKPSGINNTTSNYYIFVDISYDEEHINYYMIDINNLMDIIENETIKICSNKFNTAWGYLINKRTIINSSVQL
jgi:hypothetical protein